MGNRYEHLRLMPSYMVSQPIEICTVAVHELGSVVGKGSTFVIAPMAACSVLPHSLCNFDLSILKRKK